jgi:hypothetical protein
MNPVGVKLTPEQLEKVDSIADEYDTSRSAVLRCVVDNGLRAGKYHPDEFPIDPKPWEQSNAPQLAKEGRLDR